MGIKGSMAYLYVAKHPGWIGSSINFDAGFEEVDRGFFN